MWETAGRRQSQVDPTFRRASSVESNFEGVEASEQEGRVPNVEEEDMPRPHQDSYFLPDKLGGHMEH